MGYRAMDIAYYILKKSFLVEQRPICNVKLQKILYHIQGYSYRELRHEMYEDDLYAWKMGPVVPNVYNRFSMFGALPLLEYEIIDETDIITEFMKCEQALMDTVIKEKIAIPVMDLVGGTHEEAPWKYTHEMYGDNALIPKQIIADFFTM